jgi:hypothetical protein
MKTLLRISPLLFGAVCLTAGSAALSDARTAAYNESANESGDIHVGVDVDTGQIHMDGDDAVITAHDGSVARISPLGDLSIRGKAVAVSPSQRQLLQRYAAGIRNIQDRGLAIGEHAVQMVGGMLGTLVSSLFEVGGDADSKDLDQRMRAKAEPLKEEARALCKDVKAEKRTQDAIAASLPAFQPYAVIEPHPEHSCHIDGDDIEV